MLKDESFSILDEGQLKGVKTNVVIRVKEIAGAKPTNKMKNPSMKWF